MKEIIAIVRSNKRKETKETLWEAGITGYTSLRAYGRGKQRGLKYGSRPQAGKAYQDVLMRYLPKQLFTIVVEDGAEGKAIDAIVKANHTGDYGDGKIFVLDVKDACRISTGERSSEAVK